ncbi:GNAT family N-acetyltransferase [Antribacter gilvus]|uniref:GNAT family N-acetyltransferase n=1 Tax=Antribacter gilvus TaxID=2304675 RepID=UPI000F7827F5|nr:N-acetyltransferase [Antribacter gilvus]
MLVRPATADDAADVAWLAALTFPLACPPETLREDMAAHVAHKLTPAHFRAWASDRNHALLVAERADDGASFRGYVLLSLGSPDGEAEAATVRSATGEGAPYVELSKIYVHPDDLGSGVASALMTAAVAEAGALGPGRPLWLGTNGLNQRAQAFYRKHGFEVVGRRTYLVGGVEHDDVVMLHASS